MTESVASPAAVCAELGALVAQPPPRLWPATGEGDAGMDAFFYESLPFRGKPTRTFALASLPPASFRTRGTGGVPGMVLVHGGGGTAFSSWVKLWNARGYAAIAMDLNGMVPRAIEGGWARHENGGPMGCSPPGQDGLDQIDDPVGDQWQHHAVANVLLAHSLLRAMPGVDADHIGITGVSWGAVVTCLAAAIDPGLAFAAPVYGCGFMGAPSSWFAADLEAIGAERAERWQRLWDPSHYLPRVTQPLLWVTGTNDYFPLDSLQRSYRIPPGPRSLAVRIRMPHAHGGPGEGPEEIRVFADSQTRRTPGLVQVREQAGAAGEVRVAWEGEREVVGAELAFTRSAASVGWRDRAWERADAHVDTTSRCVRAELPSGTTSYFVNVIDREGAISSTEHRAPLLAPAR